MESERQIVSDGSLGMMVAIVAADTEEDADHVVELLTQESIPALVQIRGEALPGIFAPTGRGKVWVIVPELMRPEAILVLERGSASRQRIPLRLLSAASRAVRAPLTSEAPRADSNPDDLQIPEYDPGPAAPRIFGALSAILAGIGLQQFLQTQLGSHRAVVEALAVSPLHADDLARYITAGFLHSSLSHAFYNALFALVFGVVLCGTHGASAVIATWLFASAAGLAAEQMFMPQLYVLGASAGIFGLIGLWAAGQWAHARRAVLPQRERLRTAGLLVLLIPLMLSPVSSNGAPVAVIAHVVGFIAGLSCGFVFKRRLAPRGLHQEPRRSMFALVASALCVVLAFGAAFVE